MRSHRAINRDIAEYGLDPAVPHVQLAPNGRLRPALATLVASGSVDEQPQASLVAPQPVEAPTEAAVTAEAPVLAQDNEVTVVASSRKRGFAKKVAAPVADATPASPPEASKPIS